MRSISISNSDKRVHIDECDFERVSQLSWTYDSGYVRSTTAPRVKIHRYILNSPQGKLVDHINGDTLDNRRCNLRVANQSQNQWNRKTNKNSKTGYKGVTLGARCKRYRATIGHEGKRIDLGLYDTAEEAHQAYVNASNKLFGEYSYYYDRKSEAPVEDGIKNIWEDARLPFWSSTNHTNYLIIQRSLLQSMPLEWQNKLITMLQEMAETFGNKSNGDFKLSRISEGAYIKDPLADHGRGKRIVTKEEL